MPGQQRDPGQDDRHLERALEALAAGLDELGAPWTVIGGIAVIARGVRRMTTDIDAVIQGDAVTYAQVSRVLAAHNVIHRMEDAETFAASSLVLLLRHQPTGVDIDLSFGWTEFEHRAIASSTEAAFGRVRTRMARPQELVVLKAVAGRPGDINDAAALLVLHPGIDVADARRAVNELAALADAPELVAGLDHAIDAAQIVQPGPSSQPQTGQAKREVAQPRAPRKTKPKPRR